MAKPRGNGAWVRTAGFLTAGALLAITASLIAWRTLTHAAPDPAIASGAPPAAEDPPEAAELVDITSLGRGGLDQGLTSTSGGVYIRLEDPDTGRVTTEMNAERLDPLGQNRFDVRAPVARLYATNGQIIHVRADEGDVLMPSRQSGPESGVFRGDVRIRVFEPNADDNEIDFERDTPAAEVRAPALVFDLTFGEVSTPDDDGPTPVEVITPEITFAGRGLRLLVSEVNERIERLVIERGEYMRFTPRNAPDEPDDPNESDAPEHARVADTTDNNAPGPDSATATASPATAQPIAAPPETRYLITFNDEVVLDGEGRTIHADRLELWARLIDNKLPENAIADVNPSLTEAPQTTDDASDANPELAATEVNSSEDDPGFGLRRPPPPSVAANTPRTVASPPADDAAPVVPSAPIAELRWTGTLTLVPLDDETPPELADGNHLTGRFSAIESGAVRFEDTIANARGAAGAIAYRATSAELQLEGAGPSGVELATDRGRLACARLLLSLMTGQVHTPGAGALEAAVRGAITWQDQADFEFRVENGRMTNALKSASLQGRVRASDGQGALRADAMNAYFVPDDERPARIHTLQAFDGVVAEDGRGGSLVSERMSIVFRPATQAERDAGRPEDDPEVVTASGRVFAQKDDASIVCDTLETRLGRRDRDDLEITNVLATGSPVEFDRGRDDLSVRTLQLVADTVRQRVRLQGADSFVCRRGVEISGTQVALDGLERSADVFGAGAFRRYALTDGALGLDASWTSQMRFDDRKGLIEAFGNVRADAAAGAQRTDRLRAERLRIELSPSEPTLANADAPAPDASGLLGSGGFGDNAEPDLGDRAVRRAEAWGAVDDYPGGKPATFEARRYADPTVGPEPVPAEPRLERLMFIEGNHIIADNAEGALDVPIAGQMLLFDRAALDRDVREGSDNDRRGRAHFTWDGSMRIEQRQGVATLRENVELRHRRETDTRTTVLQSESLVAEFDAEDDATPEGASLRSVEAIGRAYAQSGDRELTAETLRYDAMQAVIDASAPAGDVTILDGANGRTIRAARLLWDLARDRVEIRQPTGVRTPR